MPIAFEIRPARADDALSLSVLGMQVYLETYATQGIRDGLAHDVLGTFTQDAFAQAIEDPSTRLCVAEREGHLLGFAQVTLHASHAMVEGAWPSELLRLYVQERFTRQQLGTQLLQAAEAQALAAGTRTLWLTPWSLNARALAFYAQRGYADVGETHYRIEDELHANRVLVKALAAEETAADGAEGEGDMVIAVRGLDAHEAHVLAGFLQSVGVRAVAGDVHLVQTHSLLTVAVGGAHVRVPSSKVSEAQALLAAHRRGDFALPDDHESAPS